LALKQREEVDEEADMTDRMGRMGCMEFDMREVELSLLFVVGVLPLERSGDKNLEIREDLETGEDLRLKRIWRGS
jgi:hypothetical protein